jgi:hypothetical protein
MGISNRDLNPDLQVRVENRSLGAVATGVTTTLFIAESPCQVVSGAIKAYGLSGAPVYSFNILRALAAGATGIGLGATITALEGSTNAIQGVSFTLGATVSLQTGDVLMVNSGVANTASANLLVSVVVKSLQDIKTYFNFSPV